MHWTSHPVQQHDVKVICYLIVCLLLEAYTHTHTHRKPLISCRYHSLGREELSKKSKQQGIHRNQSLDSQHIGALSADCGHTTSLRQALTLPSTISSVKAIWGQDNPISAHHIPIGNSALHGLMGQRGKVNIIHPLVWYGIYVECYL